MNRRNRTRLAVALPITVLIAAAVVLAGCGQEAEPAPWTPAALKRPASSPPSTVAWLRDHLPESAIGYLRLPNPWMRWVGAADHVLQTAQQDRSHREIIDALAVALAGQVQAAIPGPSDLPRWLLLEQGVPVLEVAALQPVDGSLVPDVLIGLSLPAQTDLSSWLSTLAAASPQLRVQAAPDAQGRATLMAGPMPVYLRFDARQGRLWGLTGFGAGSQRLDTLAEAPAGPTPVSVVESRRDHGGAGLSLWLDPSRAWPMLRPTLDEAVAAGLELLALDQSDSFWLGSVDRGGRAAWHLALSVPPDGIGRYLGPVDQPIDLEASGDPVSVSRLALPSAEALQAMIDFTLENSVDGRMVRDRVAEARGAFGEAAGFELDDLLDAIGPDILRVRDDAGTWLAVRVRDREALDRVLQGGAALAGDAPDVRQRGALTLHHWSLPGWLEWAARQDPDAIEPPMNYFRRLDKHWYWLEEGDYLVVADVPQVLVDRAAADRRVSLETWLRDGMDLDWRHARLAAVLALDGLPRDLYHAYIEGLMAAADLVEANVDVTPLPTARELDLPEVGRFGVQVDTRPGEFTASLQFEYSAVDPLLAGDAYLAAAVVGVLASVAIPAYQDYVLRTRVAEAMATVRPAQEALSALQAEGRWPEPETWTPPAPHPGLALEYDGAGLTVLFLDLDPAVDGGALRLVPDDQGGWRCSDQGTSVAHRFLPAACRAEL